MDRRRFLSLCVASGSLFAGCGTDASPSGTGTSSTETPVDRSPAGAPPLGGTWRSFQHDAANTGAADDPGPDEEPVERWHRATTAGPPATSPAAVDGTFVVVSDRGSLYARDAADGGVRWRSPRRVSPDVAPVGAGNTAVAVDGRTLVAFDVATGEKRWTVSLDAAIVGITLAGDGVVVATDSHLRAVALDDGAGRWRFTVDEQVATPPAAGASAVAVGLASGGVVAVDVATGRRIWDASVEGRRRFAPAVGDAAVYVAAGSRLVALALEGGDRTWTRDVGAPIATEPALTSGRVYVATLATDVAPSTPRPTDGRTPTPMPTDTQRFAADLVALDSDDGTERWRVTERATYNFTSGPPERLSLVVADGTLLLGLDGTLRAYDAATGNGRWSAAGGVTPAVTAGVVSTGTAGVGLGDGSVRWRFGAGTGVSPPAVVDDALYVGSDDSYLYALAADTGRIRWTARTDGAIRATPAVGKDDVYVGTMDGSLYAFDRSDGTQRWSSGIGGRVRAPTLLDGTVYVGNFSPTITAVDAADGTERWRTDAETDRGTGFVALELAASEEAVFAGANGDVRAFETSDGSRRWRATAPDRPAVQSPPVVADGVVLVNVGESLWALDAADGTERWTRSTGRSHRPPVVSDGTVYASGGESVYAFDRSDGTQRWHTRVGADVTLAAGDGTLYGLGFDTPLFALDATDGRRLWRRPTSGVTPLALAGDALFVGSGEGTVYALGPER